MEHGGAMKARKFAERYTAKWCSQDGAHVAAFFSPSGSLVIYGGAPAVGLIAESQGHFDNATYQRQLELDRISFMK